MGKLYNMWIISQQSCFLKKKNQVLSQKGTWERQSGGQALRRVWIADMSPAAAIRVEVSSFSPHASTSVHRGSDCHPLALSTQKKYSWLCTPSPCWIFSKEVREIHVIIERLEDMKPLLRITVLKITIPVTTSRPLLHWHIWTFFLRTCTRIPKHADFASLLSYIIHPVYQKSYTLEAKEYFLK